MNKNIYNQYLIKKSEFKTLKEIDSFSLMKNASRLCADYIIKKHYLKKILIICGPGNNGGDGALIANYLLEKNFFVQINYPIAKPNKKDSLRAYHLLKDKDAIIENPLFDDYELIIDSLFGIGKNREFDKKILKLFSEINNSKKYIISIDMPSGVDIDTGTISNVAINASTTLTFHRYKPGQLLLPGKSYCGDLILLDIGLIDLDSESNSQVYSYIRPPSPKAEDHKYSRGVTLIIAGENLIGAAKLAFFSCSQSALRAGSGLCKLLVRESDINFYKSNVLEEMILTYRDIDHLKSIVIKENCNVIIFGCGIDINHSNEEILKFLIKQEKNLVLDASIFSIMQKRKDYYFSLLHLRNNITIMTPHHGEFKRLFDVTGNKILDSINAAKKSNSIIVYKGNDTIVASSERAILNVNSSVYLATAGSGDVLAGIIGGLLSQGMSALESASLACYIHSESGISLGIGLTAGDLIKEIPKTIKLIINK